MTQASTITPQQRVSPRNRCPACGKGSWCFWLEDGSAIVCMRAESGQRWGEGWLHKLDGTPVEYTPQPKPAAQAKDFETVWRDLVRDTPGGFAGEYAHKMGLPADALSSLGCARYQSGVAAFPMYHEDRVCIGVRLRSVAGKKWAIAGSKQGLFVPDMPIGQQVIICEGPTDTAAVLGLGLYAIGRPSCMGCEDMAAWFCHRREVVIMSDHDGAGHRGSQRLASVMIRRARSVKVIEPLTGKDMREWATSADTLRAVIAAAELWAC